MSLPANLENQPPPPPDSPRRNLLANQPFPNNPPKTTPKTTPLNFQKNALKLWVGGRGGGRAPRNFEKSFRTRKPNLSRETQTRRIASGESGPEAAWTGMALRRNNSLSPSPRSPAFNHLHSRPARLVQPAGRTQHQRPQNIRPAPMRAACRGRSPGTPGRTSPGLVQSPLRTHVPRPFPDNQQQLSAGVAIRGAGSTRTKTLPQTTSNRPLQGRRYAAQAAHAPRPFPRQPATGLFREP